ncbi:MAG: hypothetical protein ACXAD7_03125 [Candidatus Kariarchaeaceae archaeon]|jgi:hypothetical protein
MSDEKVKSAIFFIVEFDWPGEQTQEMYKAAADLHQIVVESDWIDEVLAGFGGIGGKRASIWIFKLDTYGLLDKLLKHEDNAVSKAYRKFFGMMRRIDDQVREEVVFL